MIIPKVFKPQHALFSDEIELFIKSNNIPFQGFFMRNEISPTKVLHHGVYLINLDTTTARNTLLCILLHSHCKLLLRSIWGQSTKKRCKMFEA